MLHMILPKFINKRFYKALKDKQEEYGRGFNKLLCLETGYSSGFISQVLSQRQTASQSAQIKISNACGLDYKSFLQDDGIGLGGEKKQENNIELNSQQPQEGEPDPHMERYLKLLETTVFDQRQQIQDLREQLQNLQQPQTLLSGASGSQKTGS